MNARAPYQYFFYTPFGETILQEDAFNDSCDFNDSREGSTASDEGSARSADLDPEPSEASSRTPLKNKTRCEQTGNYYYGARYYNPKWSVWLSVDPMAGEAPGWTPYRFCFDNPVNLVDPTGLFEGEFEFINGEWEKVSTKGDDICVDFYHTDFLNKDGKQITLVTDREGNWNTISGGRRALAGDQRCDDVNWLTIFEEWEMGTGSAESYFEGDHQTIEGFKDHYLINEAYKEFIESGQIRASMESGFGFLDIFKTGHGIDQAQVQMMGNYNISFYKLGDKTLTLVNDSKSRTSFYYHLFFVQDYERGVHPGNQQSSTRQNNLFFK